MSIWGRLRTDVSNGRNLEIYATGLVSLALAILGVVGVVSAEILSAATLATLALLASSALGSRHAVEQLERSHEELAQLIRERVAGEVSADRFLSTTKVGFEEQLRHAREVLIVGVSLARTLRTHMVDLERLLLNGASIHIALIDPTTSVPQEAARRSTIPDSPDIYEHRLRPSVDLLRHLAATPGATGQIQIRFLPLLPAFGLTLLDADTDEGRIYVELYAHRSAGADPVMTLTRLKDIRWYEHFREEFTRIWDAGRPADVSDGFTAAA